MILGAVPVLPWLLLVALVASTCHSKEHSPDLRTLKHSVVSPEPFKFTLCVLLGAPPLLSVIVTDAMRLPTSVGLNVTLMTHVPIATVPAQVVVPAIAKSL
jgi:hypothetical protein